MTTPLNYKDNHLHKISYVTEKKLNHSFKKRKHGLLMHLQLMDHPKVQGEKELLHDSNRKCQLIALYKSLNRFSKFPIPCLLKGNMNTGYR